MKLLPICKPFATVWLAAVCCLPGRTAERPNILFFPVDDRGIADTSEPFPYDSTGRQLAVPLSNGLYP